MIKDLLPEYCKAKNDGEEYSIVRSFIVNEHEVAWMEVRGSVNGKSYKARLLHCECNFIKGKGWDTKDGKFSDLFGPERCPARTQVLNQRHAELQKEYLDRFEAGNNVSALKDHVWEIVSDLKEKAKNGEFLEDGNGALFWGGYFYLQTLSAIIGIDMMEAWQIAKGLIADKKIRLEGAVVQDYTPPEEPSWSKTLETKKGGVTGTAYLPGNRDMKNEWKLVAKKKNRKPLIKMIPLGFNPVFGPDMSDVRIAKKELLKLMRQAAKQK